MFFKPSWGNKKKDLQIVKCEKIFCLLFPNNWVAFVKAICIFDQKYIGHKYTLLMAEVKYITEYD